MNLPSVSHRAPLFTGRFTIESKVMATLSTDVLKARSQELAAPVVIALLRGGIPVLSTEAAVFAQRIRALKDAKLCACLEVGVDEENNAFVVMPQLEGGSISAGRIEKAEAERRFLSAARVMARVHELGFYCGDLTPHSFWVSRSGEVTLIAPIGIGVGAGLRIRIEAPGLAAGESSVGSSSDLGSPLVGSQTTALAGTLSLNASAQPSKPAFTAGPSADEDPVWKELLAPEVLAGETAGPSADVYSIAALGRILLATFLSSDKGAYLAPIFAAALAPDPLLRPVSAGMLLEQILHARAESVAALATRKVGGMTQVRAQTSASRAMTVGKSISPVVNDHNPALGTASQEEETAALLASAQRAGSSQRSRPVLVGVLGVLVVLSFFTGTDLASRFQQQRVLDSSQRAQLEMVAGNISLEQAVRVLNNPEANVIERQVELEKLTNSDDPLAHEFLVRAALQAASEENRLLAERAIIERARRLSMLRSGEQARAWLRGLQDTVLPAEYEPTLRLMNATIPEQARLSFLKQVLAHDAALATRLAAALALDLQTDSLNEVLAQLVGERTALTETGGKSLLALLLADSQLASLYGDDVIQRRDQLTMVDLNWILPILADRNDTAIRPLANLALEKVAVSPMRAVFLELMRDRSDLSPGVLSALVRASTEKATIEDISTFGRWIDTGAERALLALCATLPRDDPRLLEAFDTMAGRSGGVEPAASMVEWIRENQWAQRARFVQLVGMFSFADRMTLKELDEAFTKFGGGLGEGGLVNVLVQHTSPAVSGALVARFGDKLGIGGLVNLLDHPDKSVRVAAIKGLSTINEASILRLILEKYQLEKDSDVRRAYFENFWVVRERGSR